MLSDTVIDTMLQGYNRPDVVLAKMSCSNGDNGTNGGTEERDYSVADVPSADKLEKLVEDVKSDKKSLHSRSRSASPHCTGSVQSATAEPIILETRRIVSMMCSVKKLKDGVSLAILLRMDDMMNRKLTCPLTENDTAAELTIELVRLGFVHAADKEKIQNLLEDTLSTTFPSDSAVSDGIGGDATLVEVTKTVEGNDSAAESNANILMMAASTSRGHGNDGKDGATAMASVAAGDRGGGPDNALTSQIGAMTLNSTMIMPAMEQANDCGGGTGHAIVSAPTNASTATTAD